MDITKYREIKESLDHLKVIRKQHQAYMDDATSRGELVWGNNPHQRELNEAIQKIIDHAVPWLEMMLVDNLMLQAEVDHKG